MNKDEQVAVEQIDRSEAWPFRPSCYKADDAEKWLSGLYDSVPVIQAFARHRTRALEASQAGAGETEAVIRLRGALNQIKMAAGFIRCFDPEKTVDEGLANIIGIATNALTTPTRIEAAQPQEAVRKPWYCELPDSVHAEVTKQVREIQAIAIRLDDQEIQVVAEAVYNALIAAALTPPIQAAESGLLDERAAIVAWLRLDAGKTSDDLRRLHAKQKLTLAQAAEWENLISLKCGIADSIERGEHLPGKAGKPQPGERKQ